jgi:hypothetical protein
MSIVHYAISLPAVENRLTWLDVRDDVIFAVHGWGVSAAIALESYSFTGGPIGRIPSVRTNIHGAILPKDGTTGFLIGDKKLLVLDLVAKKVTARHSIGDVIFLGACEDVIALSTMSELRFERVSAAGCERFARMKMRDGEIVGAYAASPTTWWVWSKKKLSLVDVGGAKLAVLATCDLALGPHQVLFDMKSDRAIAMDISAGLSGSSACIIRLGDAHVSDRIPIPTGGMVWDEDGKVAILDGAEKVIHRLGEALDVRESLSVPALETSGFGGGVQVSPAEVLVRVKSTEHTLLHVGWGGGAARATARRERAAARG